MNRQCKIPPPGNGAIPRVAWASDDTHSAAKNFKNNHAPRRTWEAAENYDGVLFYVSPKLRVAVCPDRTQFLIQRSVGTRHGQRRFEANDQNCAEASSPYAPRRLNGPSNGTNRQTA